MSDVQPQPFKINWTAVIVVALIIMGYIGFLGYRYFEEKNRITQYKIDQELRLERDKLDQEKALKEAEEEQKRQEEISRQTSIDLCLSSADEVYSKNWDTSCEGLYKDQETKYNTCYSSLLQYSSDKKEAASTCRRLNPILARTECRLPSATADRWDELHKESKDKCYERFKQ